MKMHISARKGSFGFKPNLIQKQTSSIQKINQKTGFQNFKFKQEQRPLYKQLSVQQQKEDYQANLKKFTEQIEERKRLHSELVKSLDKYDSKGTRQSIQKEQQQLEQQIQQVQEQMQHSMPPQEKQQGNGVTMYQEFEEAQEQKQQQKLKEVKEKEQRDKEIKLQQDKQVETAKQHMAGSPQTENQNVTKQNLLNAIFVSAECAPWSKTGGLGDVAGSLPMHLSKRGHRVMVVSPRFENYEDAWETGTRIKFLIFGQLQEIGYFHAYKNGVDYIFIDHPCFHNRVGGSIYTGSRLEILFRFALLSKAAIEAAWHAPCGGTTYGDENLVLVANDWHTALVPIYLQSHYRDYGKLFYARCVFVLHNISHQGRGPFDEINYLEIPEVHKSAFYLDDPVGGVHMNIMKAAFLYSHRIVAVSPGYAWECQTQEGGWGLDGVLREQSWKVQGIVNGINYNEWSPVDDEYLKSDGYTPYNVNNLVEGKKQCKIALQKELGLPVNPDIPILGFIGRLDYQKGIDLIIESYDWLMAEQVQLIMLGSGREDLETSLRQMESWRQRQCRGWVGFSNRTAHRITAGADILLMPSRFEPCGLNQLYAMNYGTLPVVHAVGGLRDTVKPFDPYRDEGTGWTFEGCSGANFRGSVHNALHTYRKHNDSFRKIQVRAMKGDYTWDKAAKEYERVMVEAKFQW